MGIRTIVAGILFGKLIVLDVIPGYYTRVLKLIVLDVIPGY